MGEGNRKEGGGGKRGGAVEEGEGEEAGGRKEVMLTLSEAVGEFEIHGRRSDRSNVLAALLVHGRTFERGVLPKRRGGWKRALKSCFRNACLNVDIDPARYLYCEGFCWKPEGSLVFAHAWFAERDGMGIAFDTTLPSDGRYEYFGVAINRVDVARAIVEENCYGSVLDHWERTKTATDILRMVEKGA